MSQSLPPAGSGQALVLERLFRNIDPRDYCLISGHSFDAVEVTQRGLPARYFQLRAEHQLKRPNRFGTWVLRAAINRWLCIIHRSWQIAAIVRREGCTAVIGCSGDPYNIPAAYLASRFTRTQFFAYIFDDYLFQWPAGAHRNLARRVEPYVIKGAAGVIVLNEFARDEYLRRYNKTSTIVRAPHDCLVRHAETAAWPTLPGEVSIVYTGSVYHAHYDAFVNVATAITQLARDDVKLHIYTSQPREILESKGIAGPVVYHSSLPPAKIVEVQRLADILLLALAFDSNIPEVIRSSSPSKMGEYLASGRPILVLAPSDSYLSWYFRKHDCGVVVDDADPSKLAAAIRHIMDDAQLRLQVTTNARACGLAFARDTVETDFLAMLHAAM